MEDAREQGKLFLRRRDTKVMGVGGAPAGGVKGFAQPTTHPSATNFGVGPHPQERVRMGANPGSDRVSVLSP